MTSHKSIEHDTRTGDQPSRERSGVADDRRAPQAHAARLRDTRMSGGQRQVIAAMIARGHGNAQLSRLLLRSPAAEALPVAELTIEQLVAQAMDGGGGVPVVFEILRDAGGSAAHDAELADTLERVLSNLDSLWIAQQLQAFGPESAWPPDLQEALEQHRRDAVVGELAGMAGEQAAWKKSQGRFVRERDPEHPTATTFALWAEADTERAAPALTPYTTLNCWEMILLAAYNAGSLNWQWIHDVYVAEPKDKDKDPNAWFRFLAHRLAPDGAQLYTLGDPTGPRPAAGDIVLFDGTDHVALASGLPGGPHPSEVLSFFPPKDGGYGNSFGTVGTTRLVTIEWLAEQMDGSKAVKVRFGPPPW